MEETHTPNEFPFSSAPGTELLPVPLSYTSADGRQLVYTITTCGPAAAGGGGGGLTPTLLADPAGLLDAACHVLKHDSGLVAVDGLEPYPAAADATVAQRPTPGFADEQQMSPNAELVDAVTQYVQQMTDSRPPPSLVEVKQRSGEPPCFLCDAPARRGVVEIFGESNILAASKTPLCVKLELVLDCLLPADRVHGDVVCLACLQLLEDADQVEVSLKELEQRLAQLTRRLRGRFCRTVRRRGVTYTGWKPSAAELTDDSAEDDCGAGHQAAPPTADVTVTWSQPACHSGDRDPDWKPAAATPGSEDVAGDLTDPDDPADPADPADETFCPDGGAAAADAAVGATKRGSVKKKKTGMKARRKYVVADPRDPARTKTKYVYDRSHECDVCGKAFVWHGHLVKHKQTHTGERPLHCHVCGQTFRWTSHLTNHLRRHNNDTPYMCSICGKGFVSSSVFKGHMRTHTDEKPFMCGVCGRQFRDRSNLKTHEWVHTDRRPHRCEPCGRGFLTTSALKVHNRTVHGVVAAPRPKV